MCPLFVFELVLVLIVPVPVLGLVALYQDALDLLFMSLWLDLDLAVFMYLYFVSPGLDFNLYCICCTCLGARTWTLGCVGWT